MSSMITKLVEVPHETKPAREIQFNRIHLNNFRMHTMVETIVRGIYSCIENQSNNAQAELVPRNVVSIRSSWAVVNKVWEFALAHNDAPSQAHETRRGIAMPTWNEINRMPNFKMRMVCKEFKELAMIIVSCDSAKFNSNVAEGSENKIQEAMGIVEDAMEMWIGSGKDNTDVGLHVPTLLHLGTLDPDADLDFTEVNEPGAKQSEVGIPDVSDTPFRPNGD